MLIALAMLGGGVVAGVFGSLLGLGGGILIVPFLSLGFGLPVREAVGVSLVCVIVTSGASAAVYLDRRVANLRLGMVLELFTASGAVIGGAIAFLIDEQLLAGLFTLLLLYTIVTMLRRPASAPAPEPTTLPESGPSAATGPAAPAPAAPIASASGTFPAFIAALSGPGYAVRNLRLGTVGAVFAGVMSALLGIGGGLVKVPLMHLFMNVPLRVATATSNLMVGITASTSAIVYLLRGGIDPLVAGPTALGVFVGAAIGSRAAHRIDLRVLRLLFVVVLAYTAFEMAQRALGAGQ
ncbi:MAG TPA: sulfite exporter TauE/SafE family protein [Candidatus Limnocylindrales bacterium]|nr:sulfite exporter TauE/SafE family protein [Candidatus Limnocylindrales bacterium]